MSGFTVSSEPPDTVGDVGRDYYMQWLNVAFTIFDKDTGSVVYGPADGNTLFSGFGGRCESDNNGDPIVLYDQFADRWVVTQFATESSPYYECVAVSQTSDPTGSWYRYAFSYSNNMNDYPKMAVWPDGYYIAYNMFANASSWAGGQVCVFERDEMLTGGSAREVCFGPYSAYGGFLPSDVDGDNPPPTGSPNYYVALGSNSLLFWKFQVDWDNTGNSTFTGPTSIGVTSFAEACDAFSYNTCVPTPGNDLDSLGDRLMYRFAYRNFDTHESLVVNHSVEGSSVESALRWYEIRDPNGSPSVYQSGTYEPDSLSRWMGSMAMDHMGNIAIGYGGANSSADPSILYTGRLAGDTLGEMTQSESVIVAGTGSTTSSGLSRWGDYSSMNIDPEDDCTFWYTHEYKISDGGWNWDTRIASFKFPDCSVCSAVPPTGLSAAANGDNRIDLTWNSAADATEYRIYRSQTSGGPYSPVGTISAPTTSFSDTTVSGSVTYFYVVTNYTDCESGYSNEDSDSTTGTCTVPPDFDGLQSVSTPQVNTCTLDLSWNAATSLCGGTISYNIYRDTTQGFDPDVVSPLVSGVSGTTYSDEDALVSGTTYYYVVRAVDSANALEETNTVEVSGVPYGPSADGTFTAGAETGDEMYGTSPWNISSTRQNSGSNSYNSGYEDDECSYINTPTLELTAGQSSVLTYYVAWDIESRWDGGVVEISNDGGANWTILTPTAGYPDTFRSATQACGYAVNQGCYTGTDNFTFEPYTIDLSAYSGDSVIILWNFSSDGSVSTGEGWYVDDISVTHVATPGSCTTGGGCTDPGAVSIDSITDDDACAQDGVTITFSGGAGATSFDLWVDGSQTLTGVTSPISYDPGDTASHSYVVRAVDSSCFTDSSSSSFADGGLGTPAITSITDDDGCVQTGIHVNYTGGTDATSHDLLRSGTPVVTGYVSGALYDPGSSTSYTYTIRANKGTCTEISAGSAFADAADAPGTPAITSITDDDACAQGGIHVNYTAGSGATSHNLVRNGSVVVTGYASGALYNPGDSNSYSYVVRAVNGTCTADSGLSSFSDEDSGVAAPGVPTVTDDDACAQSGVTISWGAVSGATGYDVRVDGTTTIYSGAGTSVGYDPGNSNSHTFDVRASNATCTSSWSGVATATDDAGAPGIPSAPGVADVAGCNLSGVQVSWGAVSGATGYDLLVDGTTTVGGVSSPVPYSPGDSGSHTYAVRAVNTCGNGAWSTATAGVDADHSFTWAGLDVAADRDACDDTGVALDWTIPITWNDGGVGSRTYTVLRDGSQIQTGLTEFVIGFDDTTGVNGTSYDYSAVATNGYGCTAGGATVRTASDEVGGEPTFGGLQTVTAMPGDVCGLRLEWNAAASNCSNGPTIVYNIYRSEIAGFTPDATTLHDSCVPDLYYEDHTVFGGTTYYYVVRAEDSSLGHGGPCGNGFEDTNTTEVSGMVSAGGGGTVTLLEEDFEDSTGWTVENVDPPHDCGDWATYAETEQGNPANGSGMFAKSDSDDCGWNSDTSTRLYSPVVDCSAIVSNVALSVDMYYRYYNGDDSSVEVWDGSAWQVIWSDSNASYDDTLSVDVSTYAVGNADFQIRFNYLNASWDYWLSIDDVLLTGEEGGTACTTTANPVQHFAARSTSGQVKLEWQNPLDGAYSTTRVCVDGSTFPTNPATCTLAAPDQSTGLNNYDSMTLTGLTNGDTYYYSAFVDNGAGDYSPVQTVMARPFDTTNETKWSYHTSATALAPPGLYPGAAGTGASYGVSNDRVFHGMNSTDGGGDWPRTTPFDWMPMGMNGPAQSRPPIVPTTAVTANGGGDLVAFLGSQDGHVYAANAKTGVTLWQSTQNYGLVQGAPSGMFSEYGGAYDLIFAGSRVAGSGNSMYGINPADGTPAWSFGGTMGIISSGATVDYANNRLYFASRENASGSTDTLWCLQFTGSSASLVWSQAYGDIDSAPVLFDGVLYIGTNAGIVAAIDPATGGKIWSYATQDGPVKGYVDYEFVTGGPRKVFFATSTNVWALTDNGASVTFEWQQPAVVGPSIPLTLADQGAMYVGSTDGRLYQLDTTTGNIVTSAVMGTGSAAVGSPGYDWMNSLAYVGAEDGSVYAVTLPLQ